jgi:hypothetical protein
MSCIMESSIVPPMLDSSVLPEATICGATVHDRPGAIIPMHVPKGDHICHEGRVVQSYEHRN